MTLYPDGPKRYHYVCQDCGTEIPTYQGLFWFSDERESEDGVVDVPYCPECHSTEIERERS